MTQALTNATSAGATGAGANDVLSQATQRFGQVLQNTVAGSPSGLLDTLGQAAANPIGAATELGNVANDLGQQAAKQNGGLGRSSVGESLPMGLGGGSGSVGSLADSLHGALTSRIAATQGAQDAADKGMGTLLSGGNIDLHTVILASERAQLELKLTMQMRNKLIEAYQEVMRTPV
jgi:flagellar hook-basal body complex protein FliE